MTLPQRQISLPVLPVANWPGRGLSPPAARSLVLEDDTRDHCTDYAIRAVETEDTSAQWILDDVQTFLRLRPSYDARPQTLCWFASPVGTVCIQAGVTVVKRVSADLEVSAVVDGMLGRDAVHAVFSLHINKFHEPSRTLRPAGPLFAYLIVGVERLSDVYEQSYRQHFFVFEPIYKRLRTVLAAVSASLHGGHEAGDGSFMTSSIIQHFLSSYDMRYFSCEADSSNTYALGDLMHHVGHGMHVLRETEYSYPPRRPTPEYARAASPGDDGDWCVPGLLERE